MKIHDVYDEIDRLAPFATQADFDNAGLLTGHPEWEVTGIHVALDVSQRVLDEAEEAGANLLVTHHPMMFGARKRMTETDCEGRLLCRMIRGRMGLISAHTNLDAAPGGINDVLARLCGLTDISGEGYLRIGTLPEGTTASSLPAALEAALHSVVRVCGQLPSEKPLHRLAVSSGAGSESWEEAAALGCDCFLTGEMKHHHALAMADAGILALEAGHFATEEPGIFALADTLQTLSDALQWNVRVTLSRCGGYAPPQN